MQLWVFEVQEWFTHPSCFCNHICTLYGLFCDTCLKWPL